MSRIGKKYAGIEDDGSGWALFENLKQCHCHCKELAEFRYQLEKLGYLDGCSSPNNAAWGRLKLKEIEPVFCKYVKMDIENNTDEELYMLSCIALYEIALKYNCKINSAIPQDTAYRSKRVLD